MGVLFEIKNSILSLVLLNYLFSFVWSEPLESHPECKNANGFSYRPSDFSKLTLNVRELFGSRWALERNQSIDVEHFIYITDAGLLHKNELTLRMEFTLMQNWIAHDLEFPVGLFKDSDSANDTYISANVEVLDNMWTPDSFISSSRASNSRLEGSPLKNVYIFKTGRVVFKSRMTTKVSCTNNFQWYPVDVQSCSLVVESFKAERNIHYHWARQNPVRIHLKRLMQYELEQPAKYDEGMFDHSTGVEFPFVRVNFTLTRKLGNNIIQVYTPTFLVVALSWFSFWLGLDAVPGRISLLVTCMLTLVTMHSGMKHSIPSVHYITMMDVWLVSCMAMVFAAICEFVVIKYAHWRNHVKSKSDEKLKEMETHAKLISALQLILSARGAQKSNAGWDNKDVSGIENLLVSLFAEGGKTEIKNSGWGFSGESKIPIWVVVDKICRAAFPAVFGCFNIIYWPLLVTTGTSPTEII